MIIPEAIIHDAVEKIIAFYAKDYNEKLAAGESESKTYLIQLIDDKGGVLPKEVEKRISNYEFLTQAVDVFTNRTPNSQRKIGVNYFFNRKRQGLPTIHITLPSEKPDKDGLGIDEGVNFSGYLVDQSEGEYRPKYSRRYFANYNLVITSENTNEVVLIYHVLRASLIPAINHMNFRGLENIRFNGGDLRHYSEIVPQHVFARALGISFEYQVTVPDYLTYKGIYDIDLDEPTVNPTN